MINLFLFSFLFFSLFCAGGIVVLFAKSLVGLCIKDNAKHCAKLSKV